MARRNNPDYGFNSPAGNFAEGLSGLISPIAETVAEGFNQRRARQKEEENRAAREDFISQATSKPYLSPEDFVMGSRLGISPSEVTSLNKGGQNRPLPEQFTAMPWELSAPQQGQQDESSIFQDRSPLTQESIDRLLNQMKLQSQDQKFQREAAERDKEESPDTFQQSINDHPTVLNNLYRRKQDILRAPPQPGLSKALDSVNTEINNSLKRHEKELSDYRNSVIGSYGGEPNLKRQIDDENRAINIILSKDSLTDDDTRQIQALSSVHAKNNQSVAHQNIVRLGTRKGLFSPSAKKEANRGALTQLFDEHISTTERAFKTSVLNYISDRDASVGGPQGNYSKRVDALISSAFSGNAPDDFIDRISPEAKDFLNANVSRNAYLAKRGDDEALSELKRSQARVKAWGNGNRTKSPGDAALFAYNEASKVYPDFVQSMINVVKNVDLPEGKRDILVDALTKERDQSKPISSGGGVILNNGESKETDYFKKDGSNFVLDLLSSVYNSDTAKELATQVAIDAGIGGSIGLMGGPTGVAVGASGAVLLGLSNFAMRKGAKLSGPMLDNLSNNIGLASVVGDNFFENNAENIVSMMQLRKAIGPLGSKSLEAITDPKGTIKSAMTGFSEFKNAMNKAWRRKGSGKANGGTLKQPSQTPQQPSAMPSSTERSAGASLATLGRRITEQSSKSPEQTRALERFYSAKDGMGRGFFKDAKSTLTKGGELFKKVPENSLKSTRSMLDTFENTGALWSFVDPQKYKDRAGELQHYVYNTLRKDYGSNPVSPGAFDRVKSSIGQKKFLSEKDLEQYLEAFQEDASKLSSKLFKNIDNLGKKKALKVDDLLDAKKTLSSLRSKVKSGDGLVSLNKINESLNNEIYKAVPSSAAKELQSANKTLQLLYNASDVTSKTYSKSGSVSMSRVPSGETAWVNTIGKALFSLVRGDAQKGFLKMYANAVASGNKMASSKPMMLVADYMAMQNEAISSGKRALSILGERAVNRIKKALFNKNKSENEREREVRSILSEK